MGALRSKWIGVFEEKLGQTIQKVGHAFEDREITAQGRGKEREGQVRKETAKAVLRLKGGLRQLVGKAKATAGRATDNERLEARGRAEEAEGKMRILVND